MLPFWKRRPPAPTTSATSPTPPAEADLLAEEEEQAFVASVLNRRSAREAATPPPPVPLPALEKSEEIEWTEQEDVYRPTPVQVAPFLAKLPLPDAPTLKPGQLLCLMRQAEWERIQAHLRSNTRIELGGLLVGQAFYDAEWDITIVLTEQALPALAGEGTAITFSYTEATWRSLSPQMQSLPAAWTLLGSYHSHPGMGVFLSPTDLETQRGVFSHDWQIALVIDPISNAVGFFSGAEGHPCPHWRLL